MRLLQLLLKTVLPDGFYTLLHYSLQNGVNIAKFQQLMASKCKKSPFQAEKGLMFRPGIIQIGLKCSNIISPFWHFGLVFALSKQNKVAAFFCDLSKLTTPCAIL
jgi:hypothetical protein